VTGLGEERRTDRLLLRRFREPDREAFAELNNDPAVMATIGPPMTREHSDALLDRIESGWDEQGFGLWCAPPRPQPPRWRSPSTTWGSTRSSRSRAVPARRGRIPCTLVNAIANDQSLRVLLLHGPNLNLLGDREPEVYGTATLADHERTAENVASRHGLEIEAHQSNHEGELVDLVHGARGRCAAIIINPGAFTHYAWSIHDALAAFDGPVIELHLSNPNAREPWRHTSVVAPVAAGSIAGLGAVGYELAVLAVARLLDTGPDDV
jgi:3-dehydroquinate dehydratase II